MRTKYKSNKCCCASGLHSTVMVVCAKEPRLFIHVREEKRHSDAKCLMHAVFGICLETKTKSGSELNRHIYKPN